MPKCLAQIVVLSFFLIFTWPVHGASIQLQNVVSSLSSPLFVTNAHDGTNRLFIVEQGGRIKVLQPGSNSPTVFLDIITKVVSGGEQGLLGLAFHPQYSTNGRFYINYTRAGDGATVIAQYGVSGNPNVANTAESVLLTIAQPFANHNGGMLAFGPDGFLYVGMGDGGSSFDPGNRAQNINDLLGKILRIDVDHPNLSVPYSSPSTNPFFGATDGADEVYAYGFRNPWRFSFDRVTGDLLVGDVGQGEREEVDLVTLGQNHGWRVWEGSQCSGLDPDPGCTGTGYAFPVVEYSHDNGRCSVTGGYVYRGLGGNLPTGSYVYGDYCSGEIFILENNVVSPLLDTSLLISSFGEDEAGEVYVVNLNGTIDRIVQSPACTYSIDPTSASFGTSAGTGSVAVTAPSGCAWTAVSNASWITVTSGSGGTGNGTVTYSIPAYTLKRKFQTGTITIAGRTFTVRQSR